MRVLLVYFFALLIILQPCYHCDTTSSLEVSSNANDISSIPAMQRNKQSLIYNSTYHDFSMIVQELYHLEELSPGIVEILEIGRSWENRSIPAIILTNESVNDILKPSVLFVGLHHARELVSAEVPLYLASDLVHGFISEEDWVVNLLNNVIIYIIPALNPDGLEELKNHPLQRKNLHPLDEDGDGVADEDPPEDHDGDYFVESIDNDNDSFIDEDWRGGVDLNRNYGYKFKYPFAESWSDNQASQTYAGEFPFSEPETRSLMELAMAINFTTAMSFHSGTNATLFPWSYSNFGCPHSQVFESIRMDIASKSLLPPGYETTGEVWYTMAGDWTDWMYGNRSCYAATVELYQNGSFQNTFEYYNPDRFHLDDFYAGIKPFLVYWLNQTPRVLFDNHDQLQVITANEILNTSFTLMNPSNKFRIQDGVIIRIEISPADGCEVISANTVSLSGFRSGEDVIIPFITRYSREGNFTVSVTADSGYAGQTFKEITIIVQKANKSTSGWLIASVFSTMITLSTVRRYTQNTKLSSRIPKK